MTPEEFIEKWGNGEKLNPVNYERLKSLNLSKETTDFLKIAGLPYSASPFLSFTKDTPTNGIDTLSKVYGLDNQYDKFIMIGSDGSGNPIVIDISKSENIVLLDHESEFCIIELINSSINNLGACLLYYRNFIQQIIAENGDDAFLEANFTDSQYNILRDQINSNEQSLKYSFWHKELRNLIEDRKYNQEKK